MLNIKPRTLTCLTCDRDTVSDQPVPKCPTCGRSLLTVVHSALTGARITKPRVDD